MSRVPGASMTTPFSSFLAVALGFTRIGGPAGWTRYGFPDAAGAVDIRETRTARQGAWGVGCVHHLAWRVDDGRTRWPCERKWKARAPRRRR